MYTQVYMYNYVWFDVYNTMTPELPYTVYVYVTLDLFSWYTTDSSSGEYFLTGTSNGCIRIHELQEPHSLSSLTSYWSLSVHDNHSGAVTHLVTSFDDKYVLSGGADGNLFVFEGNFPTAAQRAEAAKEAKVNINSSFAVL